jgi:hypothetical protein
MRSAPPSSGQESLKSGRRNRAVSCATHRFATSADAAGPGDGPASAQVGFNQQLRIALRGHIRHSEFSPTQGPMHSI